MPYIRKEDRERAEKTPWTNGELNYALTRMVLDYIGRKGRNYNNINDVLGALEGCKLEFYRRYVSEYEDQKIDTNGEVYFAGTE